MQIMPAKLNYPRTFVLGFGFFGVSVIWGVYGAFVPLYLEKNFHLSPFWIGFFLTLDNIAALLIQPPVGTWSDKLRTPIGRRMPFILVGAPIGALAFGLIPFAHILPLFCACTISLVASMALWRTPVVALMPDITPSPFRSQANGIINLMGGVGGIAAYFGGAALYEINPAYAFWMGSLLVLGATVLVVTFIREPKVAEIASIDGEETQPGFFQSLKLLARDADKSTLFLLLALFCWTVGFSAVEAFWTLYATNHLKISEADGTRLLGQLSLVFVLVALPSGYLASVFGRRLMVCIGLIGMAVLFAIIYFLPVATLATPLFKLPFLGTVPIIGVILMVAGVAWALVTIHALPMVVDMTDESRVGTYTGLYYGFSTLAAIVGPNFNGLIVQLTGKNYNTIFLSGPIWMILALVLMLKVRGGEAKAPTP